MNRTVLQLFTKPTEVLLQDFNRRIKVVGFKEIVGVQLDGRPLVSRADKAKAVGKITVRLDTPQASRICSAFETLYSTNQFTAMANSTPLIAYIMGWIASPLNPDPQRIAPWLDDHKTPPEALKPGSAYNVTLRTALGHGVLALSSKKVLHIVREGGPMVVQNSLELPSLYEGNGFVQLLGPNPG